MDPSAKPFPGLRPFREEEEHLFFGREAQVDAMVDKLAATRFLAVVGTSGSGKSSLVNCGLVPALHRGLMAEAGSAWRVITLRPGNRPLKALAEALATALAKPAAAAAPLADRPEFTPAEFMEATLRLGKLGLVDAVELAQLAPRQKLLVVVDQFEELFRYQALASPGAAGPADDSTAFVNLLLEAVAQRDGPLYLVLTMRSDFLGECAQFFGLPEAINRSQYLVPRMTRDERRLAISGPLAVCGAEIAPVLLTRLVNDVGDNPDQLSILQHALNRTWAHWQGEGAEGTLTLRHYEAVGTMSHALNQHADEAHAALASPRLQQVCAALFKAITDKTSDPRGTRRPTRMDALVAITGATAAELAAVVEVLHDPSRSFLMPPAGVALAPDTPIDISHESLMRVWDRLRAWGDEEARSAQTYRRLAETAELEREGRAGLLRQPDLQVALDWRGREQPNEAWASRYRAGFETTMAFLQRSQQAFDDELRDAAARRAEQAKLVEDQRRTRRLLWVTLPVTLVLLAAVAASWLLYLDARHEAARARQAEREAHESQTIAQAKESEARRATDSQKAQTEEIDKALRDKPQLRQAIEQAVQSKRLVYLQYPDGEQKAMVERIRERLEQSGYSAPGSEKVRAMPSNAELRYFRSEDKEKAVELVEQFARWGLPGVRPAPIKGYEGKLQVRQFELWLTRTDPEELAKLLQQLNAATAEERRAAGQVLQDRYTASPQAIAQALALLRPERIGAFSDSGRVNLLFFLTRTAPLAWDPALAASGRETIAFMRSRENTGEQTRAELLRLQRLLDAVNGST